MKAPALRLRGLLTAPAAVAVTMIAGCAPGVTTNAERVSTSASTMSPGLERGLARADSLIQASLGSRFPGAVLVVARHGQVVRERAYGFAELNDYEMRPLESPRAMRTSTMFDLASVTKVMATTMAMMLLVDRGVVDLDAPVWRYLRDFRGVHLDSITVRHLLNHSSGLVQWQPLYYSASSSAETYRVIRDMPLGWGVGAGRHYSDLGFILLGYLVERVSGQPLDAFLERELYGPLGLRMTTFNPRSRGFTDFAATEAGNGYERHMVHDSTFGYLYKGDPRAWDGWRRYVLAGEVNDGNAFHANGGVAGHAGLFSTAGELRVLLDLLNARGMLAGRRYIGAATIDRFLTLDRHGHYLGWMLPREMPEGSFAHNGFTGTYVLGVPKYGLSIVLLTNRQNLGTNDRGYFPDIGPLTQGVARAIVDGAAADAGAEGERAGPKRGVGVSAREAASEGVAAGRSPARRDRRTSPVGVGLDDPEERVELGQVEEAAKILVQVRQRQLATFRPDLLGDGDQHAEAGAVDVAGAREVDDELPLAFLELAEDEVAELLPAADDQLLTNVQQNGVATARDDGEYWGAGALAVSRTDHGHTVTVAAPSSCRSAMPSWYRSQVVSHMNPSRCCAHAAAPGMSTSRPPSIALRRPRRPHPALAALQRTSDRGDRR